MQGSKERCKLPQSPVEIEFNCIFALKSDIWWQQFNDFPENQITEFHAEFPNTT